MHEYFGKKKNEPKSVRGKWIQTVRNYCSTFTVRNWLSSVLTADMPGSWAEGKRALKKVLLKVDFFQKRESKNPTLRTEALCHLGAAPAPGDIIQTCSQCITPKPLLGFWHRMWTKTSFQINTPTSDHVLILLSQQRMSIWGYKSSAEPLADLPPALFCSFLSTGNISHTKRRVQRWPAWAVKHHLWQRTTVLTGSLPKQTHKTREAIKNQLHELPDAL